MELSKSCKIFNEKNKKTLRIRSFGSDDSNVGDDQLPLDLEIFRNLIDMCPFWGGWAFQTISGAAGP